MHHKDVVVAAAREAGGAKGGRAIEGAGDEEAARTIGGDAVAGVKRRAARSHRPIDDPRARHAHHKDVVVAAAREAGGAKGDRVLEEAGDDAAARTIGGDAVAAVFATSRPLAPPNR